MTRTVIRRGLAPCLVLGAALAATAELRAEPLVSQFRPPSPPGTGRVTGPGDGAPAGFAVPAARRAEAPSARRARRPAGHYLRELRGKFLREHGVEAMTLFFGYYGAFLPPPPPPFNSPVPAQPAPPPTVQLSSYSMPPAPPPRLFPTILMPYCPPQSPPSAAPEPATLVSGLTGAALAGLIAWRKRRRKGRAPA